MSLTRRSLLSLAGTGAILPSLASRTEEDPAGRERRLFDGKSFAGWEGDTKKTWRIEEGALVGGSLKETVPHNDFLVTTAEFGDFILRLKVRLVGSEGFVNAGIQLRSQRAKQPAHEMVGYQADMGGPYWGALYDESRRNKILAQPDMELVKRVLKPEDWNDYEIRCEGRRIRLFLNGEQTVDYTEPDASLPQTGRIGLQIHGGGKAEAWYREIRIRELGPPKGREGAGAGGRPG